MRIGRAFSRTAVSGLVCGLLCMSGVALAADTFQVDASHSTVLFRVKHLGVSFCYGTFNDVSGTVVMDEVNPEQSSIAIEINAESVDTNNAKRDQHLRGPDFLNVKQFPKVAFKSTKVKKLDDGAYEAQGDLTLHGVTRPISFRFERVGAGKDPWGGYRAGAEAKFAIKRSDFGMKFMLEGIGDDVELTIALEAVKK